MLVGICLAERVLAPILVPGRGLSLLLFIPIWLSVKMGNRWAGIILALFSSIAIQVDAPKGTNHLSFLTTFGILACMTLVFYRIESGIARTKQLATTDPLTGLLTRRGFTAEARKAISSLHLNKEFGAVVLFDCDRFKDINDVYGHARGDDALRLIAKALRRAASPNDLVGRLGGDEFVVLLNGTDNIGANIFLSRVKQNVQELAADFPSNLQLSAGIAFLPTDGRDLQTLVDIADEKMFRQKRSRNGYTHSVIDEQSRRRARA